ncbi:MAG TPA: ABC transporter substrate-binding protein [Bacteroidia bacterium]|nr:ABC transporter substrate-binding protein [Bacteroidia bacterium]
MKKILFIPLSLALIFAACNTAVKDKNTTTNIKRTAKGDRVYGGTLKLGETDGVQTLDPYSITDEVSAFIANQIYEGLVKFDTKTLKIIPAIADKWNIDSSGTVYTFHLKKGIHFQDDTCFAGGKGRELKASDVLYSFEKLCTAGPNNFNFSSTFKDNVVGADKYFDDSKTGKPSYDLEGVKVIDDYTVQIKLLHPNSAFLYQLTNPGAFIIAKEAYEDYGNKIRLGTGAFVYADSQNPNEILLKRNNNYYGTDTLGNQLPFLDSVKVTIFATKRSELAAFQAGQTDRILGLPAESIKQIVESEISDFQKQPPKYVLDRIPEMVTQYYEFNLTRPPFNDKRVRQAFSYAINRDKIIDEVLKGEAYGPGINGICPPTFSGYDITNIKGYKHDAEKAKKLLAEAGYPDGKNFPSVKIELNSGGAKNTNVAIEIQKELQEVLNVNVDFEVVSFEQSLQDSKYAKASIVRSAWVADYPDPETFLSILYGGNVPTSLDKPSYPNTTRYKNPEFDKWFEAGKQAKTMKESYDDFQKAEQIAMDDAPVMVLWYDEGYRLMQWHVRNFYANPMLYRDLSEVYLNASITPTNSKKSN